jgi:hypothetical protein
VFDGIELILGFLVTLWLVKGREKMPAKLDRASGGTF